MHDASHTGSPYARPGRPAACAAFTALMGALVGAVGMTGAAAAIMFPTMRDLNPLLPTFTNYDGEHWMVAAGSVMNRVFLVLGVAQLVLAALATAIAVYILLRAGRRLWTWLMPGVAVAALALVLIQALWLHPEMRASLAAYHDAAMVGQASIAEFHKTRFANLHPVASAMLSGTLGLGVLGVIAGVAGAARR